MVVVVVVVVVGEVVMVPRVWFRITEGEVGSGVCYAAYRVDE